MNGVPFARRSVGAPRWTPGRVRRVEADRGPHRDELHHLPRAAPHVVLDLEADVDHPLGAELLRLLAHAVIARPRACRIASLSGATSAVATVQSYCVPAS